MAKTFPVVSSILFLLFSLFLSADAYGQSGAFTIDNITSVDVSDCASADGEVIIRINSSNSGATPYDVSLDNGASWVANNLTPDASGDVTVTGQFWGTYAVAVRDNNGDIVYPGYAQIVGCVFDACSPGTDDFTIAPVVGATSYVWTTSVGSVASGAGTTSVELDLSSLTPGDIGTVCVQPTGSTCTAPNTCFSIRIACPEVCGNGIDDDLDLVIDEGCGSIAGTIFEDVNYGGGRGRTYSQANTSAVSSGFSSGAIRLSGVEVELYTNAGAYVSSTTTNASGAYSFTSLDIAQYQVRVVNSTVGSIRGSNSTGDTPIAVQTFKASYAGVDRDEVGGADPAKVDADENSGSQTLSALTTGTEVAQSVVTVNVTTDHTGNDFGFNFNTIVNTNADGQGSLDQMVENANELPNTNLDQEDTPLGSYPAFAKTAGWEHSLFMIPGSGPHTISLTWELPRITDSHMHLTGYTQSGAVQGGNAGRTLQIQLVGNNTSNFDAIRLEEGNVKVSGLSVYHFRRAVYALTAGLSDIHVWGNSIGLLADGTVPARGGIDAIAIYYTDELAIGTNGDGVNDANEGNIISNFNNGVYIRDGIDALVAGNWIGLNKTGTAAVGNDNYGIRLRGSTGEVVIGYDDRLAQTDGSILRNVIGGSVQVGVHLHDQDDVRISGNYIGLDATGMNPLPNRFGIATFAGSDNTLIGTDSDGIRDVEERNVISGNVDDGVYIGYTGANLNAVIAGNYIGTDVTGNAAVGNGDYGVETTQDNTNTRVGTNGDGVNDVAERNIVSGNNGGGIAFQSVNDGTAAGNYIGVGADGVTALGNDGDGVRINGLGPEGNGIGCSSTFTNTNLNEIGNIIRNNTGNGIFVTSGASDNNCLRNNSFGNNGGLAIDLQDPGVDRNDNGDSDGGANDLFNMPIIESSTLNGNSLTVIGYTRPGSIVDFYIADAGPNPSPLPVGYATSFGEGETLLGSFIEGGADDDDSSTGSYTEDGTGATTTKNENRFEFTFNVAGKGLSVSDVVTAIATEAGAIANTSEFSGVTTVGEPEICNDGIDNDLDGLTDCDDPDCGVVATINYSGDDCQDEAITFSAVAQASGTTYAWSFGANGSVASASGIGPHNVSFTGCGTSNVTLTVTRGACSDNDSQSVDTQDSTPPTITSVPPAVTIECGSATPTTMATATDGCGTPTVTVAESAGPISCAGAAIIRTFTATDDCGNTRTATQVVTLEDTAPPVFASVPAAITIECGAATPTSMATATDVCDASVVVTVVESAGAASCAGAAIIRTFTATDDCNRTATAIQVVTIEDTTDPVFASVPPAVTIECGAATPSTMATATDVCDASVVVTVSESAVVSCSVRRAPSPTLMAYTECNRSATAIQVVTIEDTTDPVFASVPAAVTIECGAATPSTMATATDVCDASVVVTVVESAGATSCAGDAIIRTFTATDDCNNTATAIQVVTIEDTTAPTFASVPATADLNCGDAMPTDMATATDICDSAVDVAVVEAEVSRASANEYVVHRTFTATDNCNNTVTAVQIVNYTDTGVPTWTSVPANVTIECGGA
ncbi:MAG: beta strand repeat-containing protein, partial [Saprospiraceae bacterium]